MCELCAQSPWYYRFLERTHTLRFLPKAWARKIDAPYYLELRRETASRELSRMGTNAWPVMPALLEAVKHKELSIGFGAAEALAGLKPEEHPEWGRLQSTLAGNSNAARVFQCVIVAREAHGRDYAPASCRFALMGLAATGSAAAIAYTNMVELVKFNPEPEPRALAVTVLGNIESQREQSLPLFKRLLQNNEEWPAVSAAAALALVPSVPQHAEARRLLQSALQDRRALVRLAAARALWKLKAPAAEVLPVITALLSHTLVSIRSGALNAIREMGSAARSSTPDVERLLADENENVRFAARAALTTLASSN
jgi:hypothetical protein